MKKEIHIKSIITISVVTLIILGVFFLNSGNDSKKKMNALSGTKFKKVYNNDLKNMSSMRSLKEKMKKFSTRELTSEQKSDNEKEFARMRIMIPGNMFIPGNKDRDLAEKRMIMRKNLVYLGNKVRKDKATDKEKLKYYKLKKEELTHKIQFIEYTLKRIEEREKEENKELVSKTMMERNYKALSGMKKNLSSCISELDKLKS